MLVCSLLVLSVGASADNKTSHQRLMNIVSEYKGCSGFEVLKLGRFPVSMLKGAARIAVRTQAEDEEERREMEMAIDVLNGINRMAVVDYEDASQRDKKSFDTKVSSVLKDYSLLASVSEEDENMDMYGIVDEGGTEVSDFVMYVRGEALICLFGNISMESVAKMVQEENR